VARAPVEHTGFVVTRALEDKVAIVTGAGRGIGRGIALAYAQAGAKVAVVSRTPATVDDVVQEIREGGGEAIGIPADVGRKRDVFGAVDETVARYGTVHILVNNAQGFGTEQNTEPAAIPRPFEDTDDDCWEYTFRTGAYASIWGMKAALPHMKKQSYGRILNFGSSSGQIGMEGFAAYAATKEAIRALSRVAAREWGQFGITVNVINPMIESRALDAWREERPEEHAALSGQCPMRRIGEPMRDLAPLAVFLAGEGAGYLTGMTYMVEGGLYTFA